MKYVLLLTISFMLLTTKVLALTELGVVGPVTPAKPYYEQFLLKAKDPINGPAVLERQDMDRVKKWSGDYYPYDSGLRPGQFSRLSFDAPESKLVMPVCLIANDAISMAWLNRHINTLRSIKPVCYLVRAASETDLHAIERLIPDINVVAVNPRFVVEHYAVPHYPALISKQGIEQ